MQRAQAVPRQDATYVADSASECCVSASTVSGVLDSLFSRKDRGIRLSAAECSPGWAERAAVDLQFRAPPKVGTGPPVARRFNNAPDTRVKHGPPDGATGGPEELTGPTAGSAPLPVPQAYARPWEIYPSGAN